MANYLLAYHGRHGRGRGGTGASHGGVGQMVRGPRRIDSGRRDPCGMGPERVERRIVTEGGGPDPVTGYTIIQADSMERAVELAKRCPILESGGSVEVGETFPVA